MTTTRATPRFDALIADLAAACNRHGDRADLARIIAAEAGVALITAKSRVSSILAGRTLPNAEDTLILLEFRKTLARRQARPSTLT